MKAALLGLGAYRPTRELTNDELATRVDTTSDWVVERTGIRSRRIAGDGEDVETMATEAAGKALADAGRTDVDLVLLATCSLPVTVPGGAAVVAQRLGSNAGALDVNAGCAGFGYGIALAAAVVAAGQAEHVLVVASERLSDIVDWDDRATCILFGDGAGAAVVGRSATAGIGPVVWGSDGAGSELIEMDRATRTLRMDGTSVFRWATTQLTDTARRACELAGVSPSELAAFVPHQANRRIVDSLARQLGVDDTRVANDVETSGNTSAASMPLALCALRDAGRLPSGQPVLLLGFGAGLTYSAQVVHAP